METFLIKALQLVLSISLLVILHEGGHFFFAKLFGIRVHRFCLFFDFWKGGKRLALPLGTWGGTKFAIGWLPFGGYVEIAGMVDESTDADAVKREEAEVPANQLFKNKPAWQRLLVMVGGVLVNFLVALFIYAMVLLAWGEQRTPVTAVQHGYSFNTVAKQMGFRDGDVIVGADDKERAELTLTFNNHHDEHESHHHQTNTPHERNQSGDRARGVVQRSRDTTDQGRRGRHGHSRHACSNVGGNRINVSAGFNPDHDRGDNVVRVKTRVLVETFLQRGVDENSRSIKVGVHSVVEGRTSLIELGDDTQLVTEERKVLWIGHPDIRTDDHLHVTET